MNPCNEAASSAFSPRGRIHRPSRPSRARLPWKLTGLACLSFVSAGATPCQSDWIGTEVKITASPSIDINDQFGRSVAPLGDLDGDGIVDIAVGAQLDDDGGVDTGAVWILFLQSDGRVRANTKISKTSGGFSGDLDDSDRMGRALCTLGDLDGDGVVDLAVDASWDDDGGPQRGAVYILFLQPDGTVKSHSKISSVQGNLSDPLEDGVEFGRSLTRLGDLDGDGVTELAVGAPLDSPSGANEGGTVLILFLQQDGTVKSSVRIGEGRGGFTGQLDADDSFGYASSSPGDLDGDGIRELAIGAVYDGDGGARTGAVWILFLRPDGTVRRHEKLSAAEDALAAALRAGDEFGGALCNLGDLDGDGIGDLLVSALDDDDGGTSRGALYLTFLCSDGTLREIAKVSSTQGGFVGPIRDGDRWPTATCLLGDLDVDGTPEIAVGARFDDTGGFNRGALWILSLQAPSAPRLLNGCTSLVPGSLVVVEGFSKLGSRLVLGADNPLGTQEAGTLAYVATSSTLDPRAPCGLLIPGLGMSAGTPGELLIGLDGLLQTTPASAAWGGPGDVAEIELFLPFDTSLLGLRHYHQGLLVDPVGRLGVRVALTTGIETLVTP